MSSRNRARRDANRAARVEVETAAHRHAVHRIWAIVVAIVVLVPGIAFAISRGISQPDSHVAVSSDGASEQPSTVTVTSIVPVSAPPSGQTTRTSIVTKIISTTGTSIVRRY